LPEIDQVKLGTYIVPLLDPLIGWREAAHLRAACLRVYRPMEQSAAFRALGSAMTYAYSDTDSGQLYEVAPRGVGPRPPAIVFLHGSAGNFKGYLFVWSELARRVPFVVVAPSFGFGNWNRDGGTAVIERARRHAIERLGADPQRVFLAGLSNGGRGVTRALAEEAAPRYVGTILISAVVEPDLVEGARRWRDLPTLVVHGARDDRITWSSAQRSVAALRAAGANVVLRVDPEEDHFLFFSRRDEVQDWIEAWVRQRLAAAR
jgi:poly(3-hydroxybutyrate) depolymerase